MDITDTEAAYLAGVLDSDGHIGVVRRTRKSTRQDYVYLRAIVQIGQSKKPIITWVSEVCGGSVTLHNQRGIWNLRFYAGTLRWLLPRVYPYLVLKRRQAELVMEFMELCAVWRNGKKLTDEEKARREAIRAELEILNKKPRTEAKILELPNAS